MRKFFNKSVLIFLVTLLVCGGAVLLAWYITSDKKANVDDAEIDKPPTIYIRDDNMEEMKTFNLDGLEKGTDYRFIFSVAPSKAGTEVSFQLAVAYTENLGMDIALYPVDEVSTTKGANENVEKKLKNDETYFFQFQKNSSWTTVETTKADGVHPKEVNQNPNDGTRKTYKNISFASEAPSASYEGYLANLNDQRNNRYFVMEITWPNTALNGDYEKEVDLIYIIARGTPSVS